MIREITRIVNYKVTVRLTGLAFNFIFVSYHEPRGIITHNSSQQCVTYHDGRGC